MATETTPPDLLRPVVAEVVSARPDGVAQRLTLSLPTPGGARLSVRPGQFMVLPADPATGVVLPQAWWLAGVHHDLTHGTTVEVVTDHDGWAPHDRVSVTGPLGRGFPLPAEAVGTVVVGDELAQAPARWLAALLRDRGCAVALVLCAREVDRHLDLTSARRLADPVLLTDPDGLGRTLRGLAGRLDPALMYGVGRHQVALTVAQVAAQVRAASQVTAFDAGGRGGCGVGLCHACEVTLGQGPRRRPVRPCVEGPVLPGEALLAAGAPW